MGLINQKTPKIIRSVIISSVSTNRCHDRANAETVVIRIQLSSDLLLVFFISRLISCRHWHCHVKFVARATELLSSARTRASRLARGAVWRLTWVYAWPLDQWKPYVKVTWEADSYITLYHDILQQAKAVRSASSPTWSTPCGQDGLVRQRWHASNSEIGVVPGGYDVC